MFVSDIHHKASLSPGIAGLKMTQSDYDQMFCLCTSALIGSYEKIISIMGY